MLVHMRSISKAIPGLATAPALLKSRPHPHAARDSVQMPLLPMFFVSGMEFDGAYVAARCAVGISIEGRGISGLVGRAARISTAVNRTSTRRRHENGLL